MDRLPNRRPRVSTIAFGRICPGTYNNLSPTAKYWLYFLKGYPNRKNPEALPKTVAKYVWSRVKIEVVFTLTVPIRLHANCMAQWDILEKHLSESDQLYIALPDRPSLADISFLPFAIPWMFAFLGVDIRDWPHLQAWSARMMDRPAVKKVLAHGPKFGH